MKHFSESELILNDDGSVFHLHLLPSQLAQDIILVGDPGRVTLIAQRFESQECEISNREFHTITGLYKGKRLSVISTGIGGDNIDIVMNELDSLANIDLQTRTEKSEPVSLNIVRIGTCGALQSELSLGSFLASEYSIGIDGLINYYDGRNRVCDLEMEQAFVKHTKWSSLKAEPYAVAADNSLLNRIALSDVVRGITISANGFYGPQGRVLRLNLDDMKINEKIESFRYRGLKINNYEMEGAAIGGLSRLMGHRALTICCVIAQRRKQDANTDYHAKIEQLIDLVLNRI